MTPQDAKDQIAKKYGYERWRFMMNALLLYEETIIEIEDEAAELYAKHKAMEFKDWVDLSDADRLPTEELYDTFNQTQK